MSVRGFYHTADGDEVPITFGYEEEKRAFERGMDKLKEPIHRVTSMPGMMDGVGLKPPAADEEWDYRDGQTLAITKDGFISLHHSGKPFFTTLEAEQLNRHIGVVRKTFDISVLNIGGRKVFGLGLYTNYIWKEDQWVTRK